MTSKTAILLLTPLLLVLAGLALWWSPLNQDEGWYLMAAQRTFEGRMVYRDFAFTQPPVFPWIYQSATPLVKSTGLLGGRFFTLLISVMSLGVLIQTVRSFSPSKTRRLSILLLLVLLGLNPYVLQFSSTVKTYPLAILFLSGVLFFRLLGERNSSGLTFLLCGICCGLAAGTRLSLLVFGLPLLWDLYRERSRLGISAPWSFALGLGGSVVAICLPYVLSAPQGMIFGLWEFHTARVTESILLLRGAFVARWLRAALPLVIGLMALWPLRRTLSTPSCSFLLGSLFVTVVHLCAPFPYDEYQVVLMPVLALVIALEIPKALPESVLRPAPACLVGLGLLFTVTSPKLETWFGGTRDRIWWPVKAHSDLAGLRNAARTVEGLDPGGQLLLTTDTYLAIETGRDVPAGLEMGPFSYAPELSTQTAETLGMMNDERLLDLISTTEASVAALSGYGFTLQSPMLTPTPEKQLETLYLALLERFSLKQTLESFGQAATPLRIYTR